MTHLDTGLLRLLLGMAVLERAEAAKRRIKRALALAAVGMGLALALGATTVVLLSQLSVFLIQLHLGRAEALIITAIGCVVLAAAFGYLAWTQLLQVFDVKTKKKRPLELGKSATPKDPLWNLAGALAVGIIAGT